jgi:hypothetical protein
MSTQNWEIRLRTNFSDRDKDEAAKLNVIKAARHLYVLMKLLQDEVTPEIVVIGNDWFAGAKEINLHEDILSHIEEEQPTHETEGVSDEMMQALMEMKGISK